MRKRYRIKFGDDRPIPESKRGRQFRFPFDLIEIGQHFIIMGMLHNLTGPYKAYAEEKLGRKFVTKLIREKREILGTGVWRVS